MGKALDTSPISEGLSLAVRKTLTEQQEWVASRAAARSGLIYFPPSIGWNIAAVQRPHHLARAFATLGWTVVFDVSNAADAVFGFLEVEPDIFLFKAPHRFLWPLPVDIVWCFTYNLHDRIRVRSESLLVYDIIDAPEVFPYPRERLLQWHSWGLTYADMVTCVSKVLAEETGNQRPDILYLPNACEAFRFDTCGVALPPNSPIDFQRQGMTGRTALYVGSLARWFDFELVVELVTRCTSWHFVFVGPVLERSWPWEELWMRSNVTYLGPQPYPSLPFLLRSADVGILPFGGWQILKGLSPLKMYEFLAAGIPMVVTPFPEAEGVPGVLLAETPEQFQQQLNRALHLRDQAGELREYAARHTWLARARCALDFIRPKLSSRLASREGIRGGLSPWVDA